MQTNFSALFVHNATLSSHNNHIFTKCKKSTCKICPFASIDPFLRLNEFYLPMFDYTSCSSGNAIYIIKFLLCDSYYIGQSTNCKHRLATHIRGSKLNITTFSSCTTVVNHFN